MNLEDAIESVMNTKFITLHPKDKIQTAKEFFKKYLINHIPIVVDDSIVGILSHGDILFLQGLNNHSFDRFLRDKKASLGNVEEVMKRNVMTISPSTKIIDVIDILIEQKINCLPVIHQEKLVGIITTRDFLNLIKQFG